MKLTKTLATLGFAATLLAPALAMPLEVSLPKEASLGEKVTVSVKTEPSAKCKIEAQDAGFTQFLKLFDQTADTTGAASWNFEVPKNYKADKLPVVVTVDKNGAQDKSVNAISIKK